MIGHTLTTDYFIEYDTSICRVKVFDIFLVGGGAVG